MLFRSPGSPTPSVSESTASPPDCAVHPSREDMVSLGVSLGTLEVMSLIVLEWGHRAWRESRDATWIRMDQVPYCPGSSRSRDETGPHHHTGGSGRRHLAARPPQPVCSRGTGRPGRPVQAKTPGRARHQPTVTPCGWGVKAGTVRVWVEGKTG